MSNADLYIEKYNRLEAVVRTTYGLHNADSISYYLEKQIKFKKYKAEIKYCQDVRNLLHHNEKLDSGFAIEITDAMLEFIDKLIEKVKSRPRCKDIQIKAEYVFWQTINGNVKQTMKTMREKMYTHVPILEEGRIVGVFDENSIFSFLASEEIIQIDDELTFEDIRDYISLTDREMETFLFFKANSYVDDLEGKIEAEFRQGKRVGVVFITVNGKTTEPLQGIITPWDIIALSNDK